MIVRPSLQRGLALTLLLTLGIGLYGLIVAPLAHSYGNDRAAIEMAGAALARYRTAAAELPALEHRLEQMRRQSGSARLYLEGEDRTMAGAALQNRLKLAILHEQGEVRSTQLLADRDGTDGQEAPTARRIVLHEEGVMRLASLQRVLYALETGAPYLFVGNLSLRPAARMRNGGGSGDGPELEVGLEIYGYLGGWASPGEEAPPALLGPLEGFSEVTARPPFTPDRRPHPAEGRPAGPASGPSLLGIIIAGGQRAALISDGARPTRATEGQALAGGRLERILADRIVLVGPDGARRELRLFAPSGTGGAAPAASAPGQAAPPPRSTRPPGGGSLTQR